MILDGAVGGIASEEASNLPTVDLRNVVSVSRDGEYKESVGDLVLTGPSIDAIKAMRRRSLTSGSFQSMVIVALETLAVDASLRGWYGG